MAPQRPIARHRGILATPRLRLSGLIAGLLLTVLLLALAGVPAASAAAHTASASAGEDWPTYQHDVMRTGASGETILSRANVAQLGALWSYKTGGWIAAAPTIVNGVAYIGSWDGYEYALNATTGALLWKTYLGITAVGSNCYPATPGISSIAAVVNGVVYVGGGNSNWYALDASSGAVLWSVPTGDNSATGGHYNWSSPLIANGYAYIGIASLGDCPLVQGQLLKVSLTTHQIVATLNVVPNGQVGGGIWTSPALDPATNTIYVTTGTLADASQTYSQAILAVDANTLALTSSWQIPQNEEVPDSDWGTTPILFGDASGRQLVAAINKNGYVYAFQRANLSAGPVWQRLIAYGGDCPTCGDGSVSSMAFANGLLYAASGNTTIGGTGYPGSVRALDPASGNVIWEHGDAAPVIPALAYDNGLLVAAAGNALEVLDATSGTRLYSFTTKTPQAIYGPPSIANGTIFFGAADGTVYALALPAAPPPPPPPDPSCPSGWACQDIGNPTPPGTESVSGATWNINASGAGVGGTSDQFRLIAQTVSGDTQITAQASAPAPSSATAQAGLMVRQSLDPTAPYYAIFVEPNNTLAVQYRAAFGGPTTILNTLSSVSVPLYLEIQRRGDQVQAATSPDGSSYTLVPGTTVTLVLPAAALEGVAASSGANGTLGAATVATVTLAAPTTAPNPAPSAAPCPSAWSCADVGNPLVVGNQTLASGTWTLTGGGTDISGSKDQLHYVWQSLPGDGTLAAQVAYQQSSPTSDWERAGLMFRQSAATSAPYYGAFITPGHGLVVQYRANGGLQTFQLQPAPSATAPIYLEVTRFGNAYSTYTSTDGVNWTYVSGTEVILPLGNNVLAGLAISSHNMTTAGTAAMSDVTLTNTGVLPPAICPSGWSCGDIGSPYLAGSESYSAGSWYIQGAGTDIWNASDEFHFDWQTLAGDGGISARISQQSDIAPWAKAGVMLRLSTDPGAPFYDLVMTPGNGIAVQYRATAGAQAQQAANVPGSLPLFLEVGRSGTTFTAYSSSDGIAWSAVPGSTVSIPALSGTLLAGLAVTSHDSIQLGMASFDSVTISTCPAGWSCQDVGSPLLAGTQSVTNGTWTIQGAGGDIWGSADQFHFAWQPLAADGTVSAHVTSQTNTSGWAKAGVMLRLSTDPGAAFYDVVVTPSNGIAVQYRATAGGSSHMPADLTSQTAPVYLRAARSGTTFTAYTSSDGVTWTAIPGSTVSIPALSGTLLAGLAVTSHNGSALSTVTFDSVAFSTCPAGWSCADIGSPTPPGSEAASGSAWTVAGAGGDIWSSADQFHFDWQALAADGTVTAQVVSQTNTSGWAKAGVMLRLSSDPGAPFYDVMVTPSNGIAVQYRAAAGAAAQMPASAAGTVPVYLRAARSGTTFSAYTSTDGVGWTLLPNSTVNIPALGGTLLAGLAVTSHNNGTLSTATFKTVSAGTCAAGWSCADIGSTGLAGSQSRTGGTWTISGAGSDIWGTTDWFHFAWQTLAGDGSMAARVVSQTNTSGWAKAGVMLRLSSDPGAPFYDVMVTPSNGIAVQYRAAAGAAAQMPASLAGTVPTYLEIVRSGTTFTAYTSSNGVSWTVIPRSTVSIPALSGTLLAGLAVTSHNGAALSTAVFDTVALTPAGTSGAIKPSPSPSPSPTPSPTSAPASTTPTAAMVPEPLD